MSKISIALCTYNGAEFLKEQLESFTKQSRLPDELIVGDDCSTDETLEILENFKESSPFPVHIFANKKNLGSTKNFEKTISRCAGNIIFLSDQDDVWLPEKIAVMENEFNKNSDVGLIFSNAELIGENGNSLGLNLWEFTLTESEKSKIEEDKSLKVLLRRNVITGATMGFRSDLQPLFLPIPTNIPNLIHDGWITLIVSLYSKIKFIDESLILYRQHGNQQIGVDWKAKQFNSLSSKFSVAALSSKLSRNYNERKNYFDNLIAYSFEEIERIKKIVSFIKSKQLIKLSSDELDKIVDELIAEKLTQIAHYESRNSLPRNHLKRIRPILREVLTKRYHLFSRGFYGIGRDLLENWE